MYWQMFIKYVRLYDTNHECSPDEAVIIIIIETTIILIIKIIEEETINWVRNMKGQKGKRFWIWNNIRTNKSELSLLVEDKLLGT